MIPVTSTCIKKCARWRRSHYLRRHQHFIFRLTHENYASWSISQNIYWAWTTSEPMKGQLFIDIIITILSDLRQQTRWGLRALLYKWGLVLTVIATFIKRKDKLYNKTILDYWAMGYNVNIHHWIPILTSAIASVSHGILWWISRHIQYLNSHV